MVVTESEMNSKQIEVESSEQQAGNNNGFPSALGRQSSIYSLTLDEFQHTVCESGKNFGSMNMDEFLSSIWNAEENQGTINNNNNMCVSVNEKGMIRKQGSLTIPAPLYRKTVDEVWSEIHKGHQSRSLSQQQLNNNNNTDSERNPDFTLTRQPTFGEMTLEDFLVKAGVVREPCGNVMPSIAASASNHHQQQKYGIYPNNNNNLAVGVVGPSFRPVNVVVPPYNHGGVNVNGGYGSNMGMVVRPPVSGMGRKRGLDGPVEKVVERRQRRMIKNRESAARSRARKQAYTVELEAELNQLKQENTSLKLALAQLQRRRKQQHLEEGSERVHTNSQKAKKSLRSLRRNLSCPL